MNKFHVVTPVFSLHFNVKTLAPSLFSGILSITMRYAIGDIHGGSQTFTALLDKINLRHDDRLYLLGDYIDRGNDSKGVLDTIWKLINSGYYVRPLRGNHDDMLLRTIMDRRLDQ